MKKGVLKTLVAFSMALALVVSTGLTVNAAGAEKTGSMGFFESKNASDAISALKTGPERGTVFGGENDATNLELMYYALDFIDECNELRGKHGLSPLLVNDYLMACAQVNINWSDTNMGHSKFFNVGENLAWGYMDPFDGWYTMEKAEYESGVSDFQKVGHYLNIINPSYKTTGFAISFDNNGFGNISFGQTFSKNITSGVTVDEYRKQIEKYVIGIAGEGTAVYRVFNEASGEHLYTTDKNEADTLAKNGWNAEGKAWTAPGYSFEPVYRLNNEKISKHHYSKDPAEIRALISNGWKNEGIIFYSDMAKTIPVYRVYQPEIGKHHFTMDKNEVDHLIKNGWNDEGIAWYGM